MKNKTIFVCSKCDAQYPKWTGRCLECGQVGTIAEENFSKINDLPSATAKKTFSLAEANSLSKSKLELSLRSVNRVLGGGLPRGSLTLFAGDPGVGKSTLSAQLLGQHKVLYVSAEESLEQLANRARRLKVGQAAQFLVENNLETILATASVAKIDLLIIDSLQLLVSQQAGQLPGTLGQLKHCLTALHEFASQRDLAILVIGHVTKNGELAGPKTLEHLADIVLYLQGDAYKQLRLLKTFKNRFGATNEVALLEMTSSGFREVKNPSEIFLAHFQNQPGNVVTAVVEGQQVFLVEVQALLAKTFNRYPKRSASGFEQKRLEILTTVINKKLGCKLDYFDIYINLAGGLAVSEPAVDLAVVAAIVSAYENKSYSAQTLFFGEVGLGGEVRSVIKTKERVKEAHALGFKHIVLPPLATKIAGLDLQPINFINQLKDLL